MKSLWRLHGDPRTPTRHIRLSICPGPDGPTWTRLPSVGVDGDCGLDALTDSGPRARPMDATTPYDLCPVS